MMAIVIVAVMTLMYAVPFSFAAESVTVTFDPNGGTGGGTATASIESGSTVTVADVTTAIPDVVAPAGKTFDAWSASKTEKTGSATVADGKATFYALWKDKTATTNGLNLDNSISITGLESGDVVNFYRVLEFSQNATATGGWTQSTGFTGLTAEQMNQILALGDYATGKSKTDKAGIDSGLAATIAKMVADNSVAAAYADVAAVEDNGVYVAAVPVNTGDPLAAGLYVAIITPGQAGTTYNPVFVGADYKTNDPESSTWKVDMNPSYSPESIAKKSKVTLDKSASTDATEKNGNNVVEGHDGKSETVAAGETVSFTVETTIPKFASNYTDPKFFVTDVLSKGLELKPDTIKIYKGWWSEATDDGANETVTKENFVKEANLLPDKYTNAESEQVDAYTVTPTVQENDVDRYVVNFTKGFLLNGMGNVAQKITIKYDAVVTTDAPTSINVEDNTVTVNFSNSPTDSSGKGILKDETKHYTFDIDGNILGQETGDNGTPWKAAEVVKVGLDKDGNEITQTTALHGNATNNNEKQKIGALEGAEFTLYTDENCTNVYTNSILTVGKKIISDSTGRLTIEGETTPGIRGLDAGTYWLKETKAPEGYIKAQNAVKIEINPTITTRNVYEYYNEDGTLVKTSATKLTTTDDTDGVKDCVEVHYTYDALESYKILINGKETASYTWVTDKVDQQMNQGDTVVGADDDLISATSAESAAYGKITNTQGVELPSTGGIGTTLFYLIGSILVIGAGVVLITRRRMSASEE